jgi:putative hemolysin
MNSRLFTILVAFLMVVLAGLFGGAETGIYRLSRLRLRLGVERRLWPSSLLSKVMADSAGLLLSLLVSTTLTNYIATGIITSIFLGIFASEQTAEFYATIIMAPLLFIFAELIPKNAFLYRADALTSVVSPLLYANYQVLKWCGAIGLLKLTTGLFGKLIGSPAAQKVAIASSQSREVRALVRDTQDEGLLSRVQMEMVDRIVNIPNLRLNAVMVPLDRVESVNICSDRTALLNDLGKRALTRLLVWRDSPENVIGFVNIYDALGSDAPFENLDGFLRPIRRLSAGTLLIDAVEVMRREEQKIILVTRTRARRETPAGIITMKDLVEELIGELAEW